MIFLYLFEEKKHRVNIQKICVSYFSPFLVNFFIKQIYNIKQNCEKKYENDTWLISVDVCVTVSHIVLLESRSYTEILDDVEK